MPVHCRYQRHSGFCLRYVHALVYNDNVIKWKDFPRYWPFMREIHQSPVNSLHKGQWRGALMFFFICGWINGWVNSRVNGDLGPVNSPHKWPVTRKMFPFDDVIMHWQRLAKPAWGLGHRFAGIYDILCARASKLSLQIRIPPEPGQGSKLTHTGFEIDTCAFQTDCQLASASSVMSLGLCVFFTQFRCH